MLCVLIKKASLAESLLAFIDDLALALEGKCKVSVDSVRSAVEFEK